MKNRTPRDQRQGSKGPGGSYVRSDCRLVHARSQDHPDLATSRSRTLYHQLLLKPVPPHSSRSSTDQKSICCPPHLPLHIDLGSPTSTRHETLATSSLPPWSLSPPRQPPHHGQVPSSLPSTDLQQSRLILLNAHLEIISNSKSETVQLANSPTAI